MAEYWPRSSEPPAAPMNEIPKVVFSRSLESADWSETRIERRPLAESIAALKHEAGEEILVHGGARFAQSLSREGLIDEYHLVVHPLALGAGLRPFADRTDLELTEARPFPAGAVALTYRRR
jgi:dihydrofolate reductase